MSDPPLSSTSAHLPSDTAPVPQSDAGPVSQMADATAGLQIMPWLDFDDIDPIVADVLTHIQAQPDIRAEVGTMETVLTGPLDRLLTVIGECLRLAHGAGAGEVLALTKILYQPTAKGCRLP